MRAGKLEPTRALVDAFLASADRIRALLEGGTLAEEECGRMIEAVERETRAAGEAFAARADGGSEPAAGFDLDPAEAASLASAAPGSRLFLVEKLLDGSLDASETAALPIFETLRDIGTVVAVRPAPADVPRGRESVLRVLFVSALTLEELSFAVFDPLREIGPVRRPAAAPPRGRIGEILVGMGAVDEASVGEALDLRDRPLGEVLVGTGRVAPAAVEKALEIQGSAGDRAGIGRRRDVRVDTAKLDRLFDLVGELVTAEAMLAASPDIVGLRLPRFAKSFASLSKITRDLQETAMSARMVPVEGLFDRMRRLARDLSRKLDKRVDLVVTGAETEMDRNAIEELADPLSHMIRNAIDHGIEPPELRRAAGKPEKGIVRLCAACEGSDIVITVSDDGAGLDRAAILRKAVQRGLLPPERADGADVSDGELRDIVFLPGFSTSDAVSDVSGRGVGLDVVKRNVERLRGVVSLSWTPGRGTSFAMRVPLTLAIIDAIAVREGGCCYAIPASDIREFFRLAEGSIIRAGVEAIAFRGETLPLARLGAEPGVKAAPSIEEGKVAVVVARGAEKRCVLVDEVLGAQQVVVKPLPPGLGEHRGISGCSISGDGGVSFIVDTGRIVTSWPGQEISP
jgi:two-component system chemotaxis sensor kinase CheA